MNLPVSIASILILSGPALIYWQLTRGRLRPGAGLYGAGLMVVGLVQFLPLHTGGFPVQMLGHIALLLVAAPLLVLGFPKPVQPGVGRWLAALSIFLQHRPWVGWLTGLGVMWFWHLPVVYNAVFSAEHTDSFGLSLLHPLSLLLGGMVFAWPVLGPQPRHRIHPLVGVLYLFTACIGCSLLGLFITFAPAGLYAYTHVVERAGFFETLCGNWGTEQADAQQVAGLMMWVPCCFIYLTGAMYLLRSWLLAADVHPAVRPVGLSQN